MFTQIKNRITGILYKILKRILPAGFRRSVVWRLVSREQYRKMNLMRNLLKKKEYIPPYAGKRVLFWEPGGWPSQLARDAIFATALKLRGVEARVIICDGTAPGCIQRGIKEEETIPSWHKKCPGCVEVYADNAALLNLPSDRIGNFVSKERRSELRTLVQGATPKELATMRYRDVEVGKIAVSSVIRYLRGIPMEGYDDVLREYVYTCLINTEAAISAIDRFKPDRLLMSHACYADYGPAVFAAMNAGIPTISWQGGYLENYAYLRNIPKGRNLSLHMLSNTAWQKRRETLLTPVENERLDRYLKSRYTTNIAFDIQLPGQPTTPDEIHKILNLPTDKPIWCIFAHLSWDNVFNRAPMVFDNPESWILETLRIIIDIPEVTWLVKAHPAELSGTLYGTQRLIEANFSELPPHVRIVPANSEINTYGIYHILDGGVTLFGTTGLEMALLGKPVIVGGEAHYGNKGFTYDAPTQKDYEALLHRASGLPKLSADQKTLARQYAYSYFIQRLLPLRIFKSGFKGSSPPDFEKLDLLLPGKDKIMDMICEHIIDGGDFIMDEDMITLYSILK